MTKDEKELISTIKISLIRGIVGIDEEALLNLIKTAIKENEESILERTNKLIEENKRYERAFELAKKNLNEVMMTIGRHNGKSVRTGWLYGMSLVVDTIEKYMKGDEKGEINNGD